MSVVTLNAQALVSLDEARRYVFRNEDDISRDEILADAVNVVSPAIWDYCEREFKDTTTSDRSGTNGVTNGTTTFVSATGAFVAADVGSFVNIATKGIYSIVSVTNGTTVVLSGSPSAGTALAWDFGESRVFDVGAAGRINFAPFEIRRAGSILLYPDLALASRQTLTTDQWRLRPTSGTSSETYLYMHTISPTLTALESQIGNQASIRGWWGMAEVPGGVKLACLQWVDNLVKNPGSFASASMAGYTVTPDADSGAFFPSGMPTAVRYRLESWRRGVWLR